MSKIGQIRQGDVFLVPVDGVKPPDGARKQAQVVLAEGEDTGHAHRLRSEAGVIEWQDPKHGRMVWVVGTGKGTLQHEDHDPQPVDVVAPRVAYRVAIQRELDLAGQLRQVVD